jgi:hypothetical protein
MKQPTVTIGEYKIKYKQVPYDNRYFFVNFCDKYDKYGRSITIMQVPFYLYEKYELKMLPFVQLASWKEQERFHRFIDRVQKYNNILNKGI